MASCPHRHSEAPAGETGCSGKTASVQTNLCDELELTFCRVDQHNTSLCSGKTASVQTNLSDELELTL